MAQKTISEQIVIIDEKIKDLEIKKSTIIERIAELKQKQKDLMKKENTEFMKELEKKIIEYGLTSEIDKAQIKQMIEEMGKK